MPEPYRALLDLIRSEITGLSTTGASVYESLADALASAALPALAMRPTDDEVTELHESADSDADLETRTLGVEIVTLATTIAARDASSLEVKQEVMTAPIGRRRRYRRTTFEERPDGERVIYALIQRFEFHYYVEATLPGVMVEG